MPRPRFFKLEPEKRERILRSAAEAFSTHGFEGASLNQIIEQAGISKGAIYYYFDDKADLLATVMLDAWEKALPLDEFAVEELTAETFWPAVEKLYYGSLEAMARVPQLVGLGKLFYQLSPSVLKGTVIEEEYERVRQWASDLVLQGQRLGQIRDDIPQSLLLAMLAGSFEACDRWMAENWEELEPQQALEVSTILFEIFREMLKPTKTSG